MEAELDALLRELLMEIKEEREERRIALERRGRETGTQTTQEEEAKVQMARGKAGGI